MDGTGQEELFDVVDAADRVIGRLPRSLVHARGLRHRAAHVLVYDANGRLYLQRRAAHKECQPGLWDSSAAGHVTSGEEYAVAAARELEEELSIHADGALEPLFELAAGPLTGQEFIRVYRTTTTQTPRPDPREIAEARWCTTREIARWLAREPGVFTGTFRLIWERLHSA